MTNTWKVSVNTTALIPPRLVYIVQTRPVRKMDIHNGMPVTCCTARLGEYKTTAI